MNAWGLLVLGFGLLFVLLGITGQAETVLNGARVRSGNAPKATS